MQRSVDEERATRGLIYIGTYYQRDMTGLKRLVKEPMLEEIVFIFDGRLRDGGIGNPPEDLVERLLKGKDGKEGTAYQNCMNWAREDYADSWALASRENLCKALKEYGPVLDKLGVKVKVVGCNPRESRLALGAFARVIFEGILDGKRIVYAEASMTRVGSPIMRWLLAVTDSKTFFVPPAEWADPFLTFVVDTEVSKHISRVLDSIGKMNDHARERYVRRMEEALSRALFDLLLKEGLLEDMERELEKLRSKTEERRSKNGDESINKIKEELNKIKEEPKKPSDGKEREKERRLIRNRVEFNRYLEARGEIEEIPILVMKTILPKDGRIAVSNPLLVLKALYDVTNGGRGRISMNEFAEGMNEMLEKKAGRTRRRRKGRRGGGLVSYQKLRPVLDMLDGKFIIRRKEGRSVLLELNEFGKELAAAIPEKIYEIVE